VDEIEEVEEVEDEGGLGRTAQILLLALGGLVLATVLALVVFLIWRGRQGGE
jgi:hypothetical protein